MKRLPVLSSRDLWEGEMCQVHVHGLDVVLIRLAGGLVAYEDRCAHLGVPLSRGVLEGDTLTCSAHHYVYDAKTGCGLNPCGVNLKPLVVFEVDDRIIVQTEANDKEAAS